MLWILGVIGVRVDMGYKCLGLNSSYKCLWLIKVMQIKDYGLCGLYALHVSDYNGYSYNVIID